MNEKIRKELDNGVTVVVRDESRPVAGDRWHVRLVCTVSMAVGPGNEMTRDFIQERNFVDEGEKDDVVAAVVAGLDANIMKYLASARFPARFQASCEEEAGRECLVGRDGTGPDEPEEDDGPADFSACFRD